MAQLDLFPSPKPPGNHRRLIGPKPPFKRAMPLFNKAKTRQAAEATRKILGYDEACENVA